ncbi:Protein SCP-1 a, partial [Aphelenchoides avenae]
LYFYYTVKKFEMVKSKWGLAFASFVTVFATLSTTSGICARFDLTPTLWGAGLYPYLAMIVGLENIMCITRSVVYTPPSLDVASRLSHGLSHEGYSITKYFLLEMAFLGAGYVTMVPEIQEFCTFASIGLVVDFYMQLFFYAPCLIFDLSRMGAEDKQRFSLMLFNTDIRKLRNYPNPQCPARMLLPWMFTGRQRLNRRFSDTNLRNAPKQEPPQPGFKKTHRRTMSSEKASMYAQETIISNRLRVLYYWTKTRFFQRLIMGLFALWVLWLAFIVHKWRLFDVVRDTVMRNRSGVRKEAFGTSHHLLETAPLEWGEWQRQTFKWWPVVWQEYNASLSGHYVSFLPPIVLRASVPPDDASVLARGEPIQYDASVDHSGTAVMDGSGADENPELKSRIYWLERQMTAMLVVSTLLPFSVVLLFILYVCLWDRWKSYRNAKQASATMTAAIRRRRPSKAHVEVAPLVFSRHELPIECVSVSGNIIVSSSLDGRVLVWDASTGELKETLNRARPVASASFSEPSDVAQSVQLRQRSVTTLHAPSSFSYAPNSSQGPTLGVPQEPIGEAVRGNRANRPQIWCMDLTNKVVAMGCSTGSVEFGGTETGRLLGSYDETSVGVVHIQVRGSHVILARLNGTLETLEYNFTSERQDQVAVKRLTCTRAHKQAITCLHSTTLLVISASYDCSIKAYDARAMRLLHTLAAHTAPVVQIQVDERSNVLSDRIMSVFIDVFQMLFSCCDMGVLCCWDLESGKLLRTLSVEGNTSALKLGCTDNLLLGFGSDASLCLWDKRSGQLVDRMSPESDHVKSAFARMLSEGNQLVVLSDQVAVTSSEHIVHFWDLALKAVVRQVQLPDTVDIMRAIDHSSVLCCSGTDMYRLKVPVTYRG